ncbi:UNVERIFIED_CONTAM: hypothetical protein FKN15_014543 [Acipenser sinensis]
MQALMMTIVNLAQNFVGSNNVNILQPLGQFGTRINGGKDAASPRYIFTLLSSLSRLLFPPVDSNLLKFLYDDNQKVEPEWYIPIIPMVLVNGAEGIGTGWACKIPNYDPREIVNNISRLLDNQEPLPMLPSYKNFKGTIHELGQNQYMVSGEIYVVDKNTIEITELPVRTWTQTYKETVLEPMFTGTEKTPALISDYKEYHTDTTVKFVLLEDNADDDDDTSSIDSGSTSGPNFNYILSMPLWCLSKEKVQEILKQRDSKKMELDDLERKTPCDLWKEDLAAFVEELDRVEAQEKEDMMAGKAGKLVKGKVGKPKVKKLQLEETLPSPYGRRIVPQITPAMKADASRKMTKKKKAKRGANAPQKLTMYTLKNDYSEWDKNVLCIKGEVDSMAVKIEFDEELDGMTEGGTGLDSISASVITPTNTPAVKVKTPRVKREKKEPGTPRAKKTPSAKGTPKKTKKRNPWSDDESKSESDLEEREPVVIPRDTKSQRSSAAKPKYTFDFSEEEDKNDDDVDDVRTASSPVRSYKDDDFVPSESRDRYEDDEFPSAKSTSLADPPSPAEKNHEPASVFSTKPLYTEKNNDSDSLKFDSDDEDSAHVFSSLSGSTTFDKLSAAKKAKKPSDRMPKPKKTPKPKKFETTAWDSDLEVGAPKKSASATPKAKKPSDRMPKPKKTPKPKKFETTAWDSDLEVGAPKKSASATPKAKKPSDRMPKPKKTPKPKKFETTAWDSDLEVGAPKKSASATPKGKGRGRKRKPQSGSEEEDEYSPAKKTWSEDIFKSKKVVSEDDDFDTNNFGRSETSSRERPGRAKKEVKYFAESDDEDAFEMFD